MRAGTAPSIALLAPLPGHLASGGSRPRLQKAGGGEGREMGEGGGERERGWEGGGGGSCAPATRHPECQMRVEGQPGLLSAPISVDVVFTLGHLHTFFGFLRQE